MKTVKICDRVRLLRTGQGRPSLNCEILMLETPLLRLIQSLRPDATDNSKPETPCHRQLWTFKEALLRGFSLQTSWQDHTHTLLLQQSLFIQAVFVLPFILTGTVLVHLPHRCTGFRCPVPDVRLAVEVVIVAKVIVVAYRSEAQAIVLQFGIVAHTDHGCNQNQDEKSKRSCRR